MKRIFIFVGLLLSLNILVEGHILYNINGCIIGTSTSNDVNIVMTQNGLVKTDSTDQKNEYIGNITVEDVDYHKVSFLFVRDTLDDVYLTTDKSNVSTKQIKNLKKKYQDEPYTIDDMGSGSTKSISENQSVNESNVWSRINDTTLIIIIETDSTICCRYSRSWWPMIKRLQALSDSFAIEAQKKEAQIVKSVAGCSFGDSRDNVTKTFISKARECIKTDAHKSLYSDITFGGNYFKRGTLYFINDKFVSCQFETEFYTWKKTEAIETYKHLCDQYDSKYTNDLHFNDDEDNMQSYYGTLQANYENGRMPPIIIQMSKGTSQGGDTYYYVIVSYFGLRIQNLYNDEI